MRKVMMMLCLAISIGWAVAQTRVTGTVVSSEDGQPVIGASVIVKGTTTGTITDADGKFSFTAPQGAKVVVVSFIGMANKEEVIRPTMKIQLSAGNQTLDEIVVVAYGTAKKESLTGAVSSVNSKSIETRPVSSAASVLEGKAAGIQVNSTYGEPGSNPTVRIRGFSSVNGSNDPLYVVDGVPYTGNISDINPQDIDNMSVLKDAASSALYGNRASNGVILITTKKGKSEGVSLRASVNQGVYTRGMKEYDRVNTSDYMEIMWKGYRNYLMSNQPTVYPTEALANAKATQSLVSTYLKYNIYNKADASLFDSNGKLVSDAQVRSGYDDLDWNKQIERTGYRQDYNISGEGASSKSNYFFSAGYLNEKGYVISSDFQRFTGRANVNITPKKWISVGFNLSGSHQTANYSTGDADNATAYINPFYFARNMAPIYPVYLHDLTTGDYILDANGAKQYDDGSVYGRPQNLGRHIVWESELNMDRTFKNTVQSQAYTNINFLKNFTFTIKGDLNVRTSENQTYDNAIIGDGAGSGRAGRTFYRYKNYTFQQQLAWNKQYGKHSVDALVAHENYNYNYAYTYGMKTTETFEGGKDLVNFTSITSLDGYQNTYATESYLSRARYNFASKYFGEASFRRDGSSRFNQDNRWGNFWSLGGSWIISKEKFMAPFQDKLDQLKLRASYGEVGNDAGAGYYAYKALYALDQNANVGAVYKSQNEAGDIQWETSSSFNVGVDATIFDRANISVEYFDKRSQNLLFDVNLPLSAGATSNTDAQATITKNLGSVANRGVEVNFDVDVIKSKGLKWNLGFNATTLKNKILSLPEQNRANGIVSGTKKYMEGHGIYDFWLYQFVGVDQMTGNALYQPDLDNYYIGTPVAGKTQFPSAYLVTINGKNYSTYTTYAKKDWSGSAIPDVYGSVSSSLSYKGFDLALLCTYSLGGKTLDYSYQSLMSVTSTPHALHKDLLKAWNGIPSGMTTDSPDRIDPNGVPVINYGLSTYNDALSSRFLQSSSYFVIKNIALSYNLPKTITDRLDISNLAFNFSVENLATFTSLRGMNPQQSFTGINNNAFVTARVFSFGVSVKL